MHAYIHTQCALYLLLYVYWKLLVHTSTCSFNSTPQASFLFSPCPYPNSLLWYWGIRLSRCLTYLLIWWTPCLWPISNFPSPLFHTEASLFLFWSNSSQWPPHFPRVNASTTCWSPVCHCPPYLAWVVTPYLLLGHPPMQLLSLFCSRSDTSGHSPMKYYPSPPAWVLTWVTPTTACADTPLQAHSPPSTL